MCHANDRMEKAAKELTDLKAMQDELQAMIVRLTEEIKEYMGDKEDMMAGTCLVTYRPVISFRVDTSDLRSLALCTMSVRSCRCYGTRLSSLTTPASWSPVSVPVHLLSFVSLLCLENSQDFSRRL